MDHRSLVTTKLRSRSQYKKSSLRETQLLEDIYGFPPTKLDVSDLMSRVGVLDTLKYFPLQLSNIK